MLFAHFSTCVNCFDIEQNRFTEKDNELKKKAMIRILMAFISQVLVFLTVKKLCLQLFSWLLLSLSIILGAMHHVSEIKKRNKAAGIELINFNFIFFIMIVWQAFMIYVMRLLDYELLKSNNLHNETKQEYHAILELSCQSIISHDDEYNIQYFNSKGLDFLKDIAKLTSDEQKYTSDL